MPISHIVAEGIGPFKKVHLDLRGPDGKASYGPHVLAGVNGSGKSTILKGLAWCIANKSRDGFPIAEWAQFLPDHAVSRVLVVFEAGDKQWARAVAADKPGIVGAPLDDWVANSLDSISVSLDLSKTSTVIPPLGAPSQFLSCTTRIYDEPGLPLGHTWAAYSPSRALRRLDEVKVSAQTSPSENRFSFEETVSNEALQEWLVGLYSRRAIARDRNQETEKYNATFRALELGLQHVFGNHVSIVVDIEAQLLPKLKVGKQTLNFSQVPDGIKSTLGWMADFMRRCEDVSVHHPAGIRPEGILLFDEIETFLHPVWQRRVLPAMRAALHTTQFLVTSHSPFVISSCRDAMIHVLKLGNDGYAYAEPPVNAPIGESITSTLKDIFGVDSRFDVETEDELKEWNDLHKTRSSQKLTAKDEARFKELTRTLGGRSEELHSIVNPVPKLAKSTVDSLTGDTPARSSRPKRAASR
ncbi:MAG: AAA family ATPase [Acidobacteriota bacterium]